MDTRIKIRVKNTLLLVVAILFITLWNRFFGFENTVLGVLVLCIWRWWIK